MFVQGSLNLMRCSVPQYVWTVTRLLVGAQSRDRDFHELVKGFLLKQEDRARKIDVVIPKPKKCVSFYSLESWMRTDAFLPLRLEGS